jgi:sterol desaturase/sphingolipid hydroxylase (fatty acid hydroxylase superfamily)
MQHLTLSTETSVPAPQRSTTPVRRPAKKRAFLNVHRLYGGAMAKPIPATIAHFAGMAAVVELVGARSSRPAMVPWLVTGFMGWTLFEYALHRWILHSKNPVLWKVLHKEHHGMRVMEDPNHRLLHPLMAIPMMGGATLLLTRAGGPPLAGVGFWVGYVAYELIHWVHHDARLTQAMSRVPYFRRRVIFHHDHHFKRADTHFGFTVGLWDHVFGTAEDTSNFDEVRERVVARTQKMARRSAEHPVEAVAEVEA